MDFGSILKQRLENRQAGMLDIRSDLLHFALINYTLPVERLRPHIHPRFEIPAFPINGRQLALMSAVPFLDSDFSYYRLLPFIHWEFAQTNYRVYVIDRETREHCVWFFGTTLGSRLVQLARTLWKIPWHFAKYELDCRYNETAQKYDHFRINHYSNWATAEIELEDTGVPVALLPGFDHIDEQKVILTHPVEGFFFRLDGRPGTYSVWHREIPMTIGTGKNLYFSLYERLGLLSRDEMQQPHSILICPRTTFEVHLPPFEIKNETKPNDEKI